MNVAGALIREVADVGEHLGFTDSEHWTVDYKEAGVYRPRIDCVWADSLSSYGCLTQLGLASAQVVVLLRLQPADNDLCPVIRWVGLGLTNHRHQEVIGSGELAEVNRPR
jgi:hypothetical protein